MRVSLPSLDEAELVQLAVHLAPALRDGGTVYLRGDLGAGKTTFARALLQALGVDARIKSPTYSLIESYRVGRLDIHHLDLYRIADPGELEWLGIGELADGASLLLIEWPERGAAALPEADLQIGLSHAGAVRDLVATASGASGEAMLAAWDPSRSARQGPGPFISPT
ncbi:tRNA (adenosine(37)-N6)-threonylcarbamoyltransferase complex ATPase subunit type 1 TsaE [Dokdonella sp.]|uniref:tRNA (adenosine(37)-N6)-threonylcarbamoyltransferase complex ATPase subunit type 1 TsaE n=1 Tax=Dokdonella sp. TaxID=2291710 RepID=UPI002F421D70